MGNIRIHRLWAYIYVHMEQYIYIRFTTITYFLYNAMNVLHLRICSVHIHRILNDISLYIYEENYALMGFRFWPQCFWRGDMKDPGIAETLKPAIFVLATTIWDCRLHVFAIGLDALVLNSHLNHFQHQVSIFLLRKIGVWDVLCPDILYEYVLWFISCILTYIRQ